MSDKTIKFELRGFPGFLVGSIIASVAAVVVVGVVLLLAVGIPLFFLTWGVVELWAAAVKKVRSFRRAKAPTWQERKASKHFIRR